VQGIFPIGSRILAQDEACRSKFPLCGCLLQLATARMTPLDDRARLSVQYASAGSDPIEGTPLSWWGSCVHLQRYAPGRHSEASRADEGFPGQAFIMPVSRGKGLLRAVSEVIVRVPRTIGGEELL
jgi:hypothetical protein